MTELETFLPHILPYAPGCPEPTALAAIIKAAQDFAERTRLWRDEDSFATGDFNIVCAPQGADLFEIEHASLDGYTLEPISLADLDYKVPDWRDQQGSARYITQAEPGSVRVVPKAIGTLRLATILRPANDCDQLPDWMAQHYLRVIADGALAEILMTPGQPFTAPDRAQFYGMRFEARLAELTNQSIKGQQRAKSRTRAQFF